MAKRPAPRPFGSFTLRAMGDAPADGRWLWRLEWYPDGERGKQRTHGLGRHPVADVEAVAHRAIAELGAPSAAPRATVGTWGVLLRAWLAHVEHEHVHAGAPTASTVQVYRRSVGYLYHYAAAWPLPTGVRALAAQATEMRDRLQRTRTHPDGLAASTTQTTLAVARAAWGWGVREEMVAPLPWQAPRLVVPPVARYVPTHAEALRVTAALQADVAARQPPYGWPLVAWLVHYATSPRIGELAALVVGDLDLQASAVWYGRHEGNRKTGARRSLMDAGTLAALQAYLQLRAESETLAAETRVWPVTWSTMAAQWWPRWIRPAQVAAGLPTWTPHTARGSLADDMAEGAVDDKSADSQLGNTAATRDRSYRRPVTGLLLQTLQRRALVPAPDDGTLPFRKQRS